MNVRAKFYCAEKTQMANGQGAPVNGVNLMFRPVTGGTPENQSFWKATPGGELKMFATNPEVAAAFEPGKAYYLDFSEAP